MLENPIRNFHYIKDSFKKILSISAPYYGGLKMLDSRQR